MAAIKLVRGNGNHAGIAGGRTEPLPSEMATVPGPGVEIYWPVEELYPRIQERGHSNTRVENQYVPFNVLVSTLCQSILQSKNSEAMRSANYSHYSSRILKAEIHEFGTDIFEVLGNEGRGDNRGARVAEIRILPNTLTVECRVESKDRYDVLRATMDEVKALLEKIYQLDVPATVLRCYV
jgi:hypothetical protein